MTRFMFSSCRRIAIVSMAFLGLSFTTAAGAQDKSASNALQAIDVESQAGKVVVKLKLKHPLATPPVGFSLANPPRVAFDFPALANETGSPTLEVSDGDLRSVRIGEGSDRTRVVFNLARAMTYDSKVDGQNVNVTLLAAGAQQSQQFAEGKPSKQPHAVRKIDFKRGRGGEGQVIIDLSDTGTGIDIRQQGKNMVIDLLQTDLPKGLEKRFDATDFGTPVEYFEATSVGEHSRITIHGKGKWEQAAYQTDNRFVVELKPFIETPSNTLRNGFTGEKLSLNFQNVEVRAVLQVIADFTGLNIVTSDTVAGNLTLRLKDVPWDQALDIILQAKGLDMRKNGNVVWIAPRDELATREKLAFDSQNQLQDLEPVRTESFQLNYQKAESIQKILADTNQKVLSKRGSVVIDPRTNTLFVQDTPSKLDEVRALIKQVDVSVRQVLIESRIVEAKDTFARNIGARPGFIDFASTRGGRNGWEARDGVRIVPGGNVRSMGVTNGYVEDYSQSFYPDSFSVNMPANGINGVSAGQFGLSLFNNGLTRFLNLEISALQADGKGKVISSPRVITADNVEALIEQGTEIPYEQATSSGATSVSFRKATLSLKVKPQITPDDNVIMKLDIHKDAVGATTTVGPSIDTKQIQTEVLVENGGTVGIGGIYAHDEDKSIFKVPFLGDIPIIGSFFKNEVAKNERKELLIFVTPKILRDKGTGR